MIITLDSNNTLNTWITFFICYYPTPTWIYSNSPLMNNENLIPHFNLNYLFWNPDLNNIPYFRKITRLLKTPLLITCLWSRPLFENDLIWNDLKRNWLIFYLRLRRQSIIAASVAGSLMSVYGQCVPRILPGWITLCGSELGVGWSPLNARSAVCFQFQ